MNILELMQRLIAYKYSCKNSHWASSTYAHHLLCDRLQEDIDDMVDDLAERFFMAREDKKVFTKDILKPELINKDLVKATDDIVLFLEKILKKEKWDQGMQSLLTDIESRFHGKRALVILK